MEYRYLGRTGLRVSNLCFGTLTFGANKRRPGQADEELAHRMLDLYVSKGGNFIDTADFYQFGASEEIVGRWLEKQPNRNKLIVATKFFGRMSKDDPNAVGASRHHILESVENSLERLRTRYIDLLYVHVFDFGTPVEETLRALNDVVCSGRVHYIGASNFTGWQLQKALDVSKYLNMERFCCTQMQYSLLCRDVEFDSVDVCDIEGVGLLPWSPLKGGFLTGKISRIEGKAPEGSRIAAATRIGSLQSPSHPSFDHLNDDRTWKIIDLCREIAEKRGKSCAQVALRWLMQKPFVTSVVFGAKNLEQLDDNLGAIDFELTDEEMKALDEISEQKAPAGVEMIRRLNQHRKKAAFYPIKNE